VGTHELLKKSDFQMFLCAKFNDQIIFAFG